MSSGHAAADEVDGVLDTVYRTTVTAVGDMVAEFSDQGVMILFGDGAPEELWEFAVLHRPSVTRDGPRPGDVIEIDGTRWPVLAVGHVVEGNLLQLGHMDIKADGCSVAALPGDVCVPQARLPLPAVGGEIRVLRPERADEPDSVEEPDSVDEPIANEGEQR